VTRDKKKAEASKAISSFVAHHFVTVFALSMRLDVLSEALFFRCSIRRSAAVKLDM
jgi:hypothetical protein